MFSKFKTKDTFLKLDLFFYSCIAISFIILLFFIYRIINLILFNEPNDSLLIYYSFSSIFCFFSLIFFLYILNNQQSRRKKFFFLILSSLLTIYGFEIFFNFPNYSSSFFFNLPNYYSSDEIQSLRIKKAHEQGLEYDERDILQVIKDYEGTLLPNFNPGLLVQENFYKEGINTSEGVKIFPISSMSDSKTIFTNDNGYYPIIQTDSYGFSNEKSLYDNDKVDIVLVGDSYVEGLSVYQKNNIASNLSNSGFITISLAKAGNGPLIKLASIKEYASSISPDYIIWFFCSNDLSNLRYEMNSNILEKYLINPKFTQNLIMKQDYVDEAVNIYISNKIIGENIDNNFQSVNLKSGIRIEKVVTIIKLTEIRNHIYQFIINIFNNEYEDIEKIILNGNKEISKWEGKLYVVYLPSFSELENNNTNMRDKIYSISENLNIETIDVYNEFQNSGNYKLFFPFELEGHYNIEGYKLLSDLIIRKISK